MKKTSLILTIGLILVGVFSTALPARGATVASFTAVKDAWVWEALPDNNYGQDNFLYIGNFSNSHESAYVGFTFVKPAATWTKAEIQLTTLDVGIDFTVYVDAVTGPWNETGMQGNITWNNRPALGAPITTLYFYKELPTYSVMTIDITSLMPSLTNNISICLYVITLPPAGSATLISREDSTESHRPLLVFTNQDTGIAGYDIAFLGLVTFGMVFFWGKKIMSKHSPK